MNRLRISLAALVLLTACSTQPPVDQRVVRASIETDDESLLLKGDASGALLAATCFGCHGPEGRSRAPAVPSLAGLSESYFISVMQAYQYGGRFSSIMGRIALGFEQDEIARMARYFSHLDYQPHTQRVNWRQVKKGRRLHRLYCLECHGDSAQDASEKANRLNGQWMDYLRWTLQDYLIGINQADARMSEQLAKLVRRHGSEGLEALVNYFGSARP